MSRGRYSDESCVMSNCICHKDYKTSFQVFVFLHFTDALIQNNVELRL